MTQTPSQVIDAIVQAAESAQSATLQDFVNAASTYVMNSAALSASDKKRHQIALSRVLGFALKTDLVAANPRMANIQVGEIDVYGGLRRGQSDLVEFHDGDGIRFAAELKPVNLAVGRAIWNRFGDIRMFAVNVHIKFPFSVLAGILTVPTIEIDNGVTKSTVHLIDRLIKRLAQAGSRDNETGGSHLLEGIAVVAYDPQTQTLLPASPQPTSQLRWENCVQRLASLYDSRFGED